MVRFELAADITELKRTEQQLRHTVEKLAQSNQDLQQFAYVASHDLQEPLRMVSSFTQLLSDRYADQLDEKAQSWIHYAVDGAQRMQILIQDLLSFSRVNTHGNEFSRINLSIPASQAIQNLSLRIEETGAVIDTQALPSLPVDGTQITQLFQNLLANALKFSDHQPQIRIRAAEKKSHWVLSVEDNGIGIDPEFQKKVFIIFQRLHTRSQYPGTGLGLAVCKRIIQRHGGRIWVASEPGKGSVFSFSLPKE